MSEIEEYMMLNPKENMSVQGSQVVLAPIGLRDSQIDSDLEGRKDLACRVRHELELLKCFHGWSGHIHNRIL